MEWQGGAPMSRTGAILMVAAFGSWIYLFIFRDHFVPVFWIGFGLFGAAFVVQEMDKARYRRERKESREMAMERQPALKSEPLTEIPEAIPENREFPLVDRDSGEVVVTLRKSQLQALINQHREWGMDPNDFYIMTETVEVLDELRADQDLVVRLRQAMRGRDDMEVRWILPEA